MNIWKKLLHWLGNGPRRRRFRLAYWHRTGKYLWGLIQFCLDTETDLHSNTGLCHYTHTGNICFCPNALKKAQERLRRRKND